MRWHRSDELKDTLILEDIDWIYNVFATVEPEMFAKFEADRQIKIALLFKKNKLHINSILMIFENNQKLEFLFLWHLLLF